MGETLTLVFRRNVDETYEVQVKEGWSGRTVSGKFVPPYTAKQLTALHKKLNTLENNYQELREIGYRLFMALCGAEIAGMERRNASEQSVQALLRGVIQRTLRRRGTVALTFCFSPGCEEFVRYPWELLHNGDHFLLVSGIFTLTRALLRPDNPVGCELPVHPPLRVLYIGCTPTDRPPLETENSFSALARGLEPLIVTGQVLLERLEPPTFDQLVRYLNLYGGASTLDDGDTYIPCYVVHFDGHGAYGKLCSHDGCDTLNEAGAHKCVNCGTSLSRVRAQTYLCFCNEFGCNQHVDTHALRELFLSSDVRLAVFSACETATVTQEQTRQRHRNTAVDASLATALVTAQVPAVVAMPFYLQDDLSPTFMYHFYEALAEGRTLEEALSRSRQALLPVQQGAWFIPVLYRHMAEGQEMPVPLLVNQEVPEENEPLAHLSPPSSFVGRERELQEIEELLVSAAKGEQIIAAQPHLRLRPGTHHIALTGPAGIGKSALACEVARRNREKFPGGVIGVSLQGGKAFGDALVEIIHALRTSYKTSSTSDLQHRERFVLGVMRSLASRELPCLLLLDNLEEIKDQLELETWLRFLCALPREVVVLITSRSNPEIMAPVEAIHCRWYEYHVNKMTSDDLLQLFTTLAEDSGLDQRIHLDDPRQQAILREICTLLDGYPLGAELIFGTSRSIGGKLYTPEAATRSLEEVRDELRSNPLAGILAVLEVAYKRLTPAARLLLAYLAAFRLPFSREQIIMLVAPEKLSPVIDTPPFRREQREYGERGERGEREERGAGEEFVPVLLIEQWSTARDELVEASFLQFDGRVYTIHPQVRHFALSHLPIEERRRIHRVVAAYYYNLPHPSPEEWFAAFTHLEDAGKLQDLQEAVRVAVSASWALEGHGHEADLQALLRRASVYAVHLGDKTSEGKIQCCLGAILRQLGQYAEAEACLRSSLEFHKAQQEQGEAGWALYELAMLFREEGNFQQAGAYAQEALNLFRNLGDAKGEAWMQMVMGEVSRGYGNYYDAIGHFDLALASFQALNNKEGRALTLHDRGTVYEALGQYVKALYDYDESFRLFSEMGIRTGQAWVLSDKSIVYTDQGKLELAQKACSEAITIFHEQGIRRGEAWARRAMGYVLREQGDYEHARVHHEEALALFTALGDRVDQARVLNALGAISFVVNDYLAAKEFYEQAQFIAHEQGARQVDGRALRGLGDITRVFRAYSDAARYYHDAATIATELDTPAEHCAVLRRQGLLAQTQRNHPAALDYWVQALALDQRLGHPVRAHLQEQVNKLVTEQHLEELYNELCKRHGLEAAA